MNIQSRLQQVFLWIGAEANATEKKRALTTAQEYLHTHPSGRDPDTPILIIKQGFEPPIFTGWFLAWDSHLWSVRTQPAGKTFLLSGSSVGRWGTQGLSKSKSTFPLLPVPSLLSTFLPFPRLHSTKSSYRSHSLFQESAACTSDNV